MHGIKEMVLVPKQKADVYDVSIIEETGTSHREIHDDSSSKLREGQAAAKFDALAQSARDMAAPDENMASESELEKDSSASGKEPKEGQGGCQTDASSQSDEDEYSGVQSSLWLGDSAGAKQKSAGPAKSPAKPIATKKLQLSSPAKLPPRLSPKKPPEAEQSQRTSRSASQRESEVQDRVSKQDNKDKDKDTKVGRTSFANKMADKSPAEV